MELILARHGNTFKSGEPAVWVGSQNDLPLVESGEAQAKLLGQTLLKMQTTFTSVYTGPLIRMTAYAKIILSELKINLHPTIDLRLNEINYGKWSGLTRNEICEKFGADEFEKWENHSQWPQSGGWDESEQALIKRIKEFSNHLTQRYVKNEKILVVGSNGSLRYFLDLIPGKLQHHIKDRTVKIATGNISKLTYRNESWKLDFWNFSPQQMLAINP